MKNYVPALLLTCVSSLLAAQSPDFSWVKQMGGLGREMSTGINVDASGNIYTSGYFDGTPDFDPGAGTNTLTALGSAAAYISKVDAQGSLFWVRKIDAPVAASVFKVRVVSQALFSNGDICVTGDFSGLIDFDPGAGNAYLYATQAANAFIARYDALGNYVWAKSLKGNNIGYSNAITIDALNNVYTTGHFTDTTDFDPGVASYTLASEPGNHIEAFVLKLNSTGDFVWARRLTTTGGGATGVDIALDAGGNVYSAGAFRGTSDFDPGAGTNSIAPAGDQDAYLWKLDASGNFVWAKTMGGSASDAGLAVIADAGGNVYMSGSFEGSGDFDPGAGMLTFTSAGNNDIFYSKFDPQGNQLWANTIGGTGNDVASTLAMDAGGNLFTSGYFENTVDFDATAGVHSMTAADRNTFISKLNAAGNLAWVKHLEGNSYNGASAITVNAGNILATGSFSAVTDFDPSTVAQSLTAVGGEDAFILKLVCSNPPSLVASSSSSAICAGSSATLTASGASTYTWNTNGTNPYVISPAVNTTYTLNGKDANGCSAVVNFTQLVDICTGLNTISANAGITVYPNPVKNMLTVNTVGVQGFVTIQVLNALGQIVITEQSEQASLQLNTEKLPAGLYGVNVLQQNKVQARVKLIKE